jgi:predicted nucleic acid-binding protein
LRGERSLRIFLDTSVLSHSSLSQLSAKLVDRVVSGDEFLVSTLTHFEILWGHRKAALATERYEAFLSKLDIGVAQQWARSGILLVNRNSLIG